MSSLLRPATVLLLILAAITGIVYPALITGIAQVLFRDQASGSLITHQGRVVGSRSIGQQFSDPKYFWGRPSATTPQPYNGIASNGSNLGPLNPALLEAIQARISALKAADPTNSAPVPVDLVTASASGLDPEISVAAADYQAARVAHVRGLKLDAVKGLIAAHSQGRLFGILGEPRINVLTLNLALDDLQ
jgi:potassium-transporting ATPase KdpC subunit